MLKTAVLESQLVIPRTTNLVPRQRDHPIYSVERYIQNLLPLSKATIRSTLREQTSNVTNMILLMASSSQSSIGTTISSGTGLVRGGGGGFSLPTEGSLEDCSNTSVRGRGVGVGDETSGFCGDGDGAEVASLANRLARTYEQSAQAFGWQQLPYRGHLLEQTFAV
jgi:hypothetical protein